MTSKVGDRVETANKHFAKLLRYISNSMSTLVPVDDSKSILFLSKARGATSASIAIRISVPAILSEIDSNQRIKSTYSSGR